MSLKLRNLNFDFEIEDETLKDLKVPGTDAVFLCAVSDNPITIAKGNHSDLQEKEFYDCENLTKIMNEFLFENYLSKGLLPLSVKCTAVYVKHSVTIINKAFYVYDDKEPKNNLIQSPKFNQFEITFAIQNLGAC